MTSPLSYLEMVVAYVAAAAVRGLIVGAIIAAVGFAFVPIATDTGGIPVSHGVYLAAVMCAISALFAGLGIIGGLAARDFDDLTVMNQFILRPLVFFGAVFYSLEMLGPYGRAASLLNPMVVMVDGVRYGMLGYSGIAAVGPEAYAGVVPYASLAALLGLALVVLAVDVSLFKRGYGLTE